MRVACFGCPRGLEVTGDMGRIRRGRCILNLSEIPRNERPSRQSVVQHQRVTVPVADKGYFDINRVGDMSRCSSPPHPSPLFFKGFNYALPGRIVFRYDPRCICSVPRDLPTWAGCDSRLQYYMTPPLLLYLRVSRGSAGPQMHARVVYGIPQPAAGEEKERKHRKIGILEGLVDLTYRLVPGTRSRPLIVDGDGHQTALHRLHCI